VSEAEEVRGTTDGSTIAAASEITVQASEMSSKQGEDLTTFLKEIKEQ